MGNIQVLSFEVANLIAAGEVVDRPASAIKEMMENAIDAGARHITVEIQSGGVSLMRVTDDGCGMSAEDLPMAIRRHATSKIRDAADLDGIITLGFRGEALAAISSVSDMRIMSKRREDDVGSMLEVRGGTLLGVSEFGCGNGTTVIVEHLFANVPARRKFLKRDATEAMAVGANVERVALSHPEIAVRFISDGVLKLDTAGDGQLKSAVYAVYGRDFAARLIPLAGEFEGVEISGFIGRSDNVRANRNGQSFFINHRYVKSRTAQAALEQAFVSYLPAEKYPVCVMNIGLNPARVDVNVHPAKLEVKFSNEKPVFEAIYYTVRQALEQDTGRPALKTEALKPTFAKPSVRLSDATAPIETERQETLRQRQVTIEHAAPVSGGRTSADSKPPQERITAEEYISRYVTGSAGGSAGRSAGEGRPVPPQAPIQPASAAPQAAPLPADPLPVPPDDMPVPPPPEEPPAWSDGRDVSPDESTPAPPEPQEEPAPQIPPDAVPHTEPDSDPAADLTAVSLPYRIVGEVFFSYVIVEQGERMLLIDKHAAHERVLFEKLKSEEHPVMPQLLLQPVPVQLTKPEAQAVLENLPLLQSLGFDVSEFSDLQLVLRQVPAELSPDDACAALEAFAEDLLTGKRPSESDLRDNLLHTMACKAAIKAGWHTEPKEREALVREVLSRDDIKYCPHGRPVCVTLTKRQLEKQFKRV